jgi:hypothetical protein
MRHSALVFCLFLLSGCTGNVSRLHDLNPSADDFPSALASEYQSYADSEMELGRLFSAEHFAGKGLTALKGENVEPDSPRETMRAAPRQELSEARIQLMKLLNDDMKRDEPQKLARTQLLYDCWLHEVKKGIDQERAPCADEFQSNITELQEIYDAMLYGQEKERVIVFAYKSKALDEGARAAIKEIADIVTGMPGYRVELMVYTGRKLSQRRLTDARLAVVRKALVKAGVSDRYIRIKKVGGSKVVILSRDGIAMDTKKITVTVKTHHHIRGQ